MLLILLLTIASALLSPCHAHMRWVDPAPRTDGLNLPDYPCGGVEPGEWADGEYTEMAPGARTVTWEEAKVHPGAAYRIALIKGGHDKEDNIYVLLDHIPHNDASGATNTTLEKASISVDIPDVDCGKCVLQILSVMTDKIEDGKCCTYPGGVAPCPYVYHSCANINITGSGDKGDLGTLVKSDPGRQGPYYKGESATWLKKDDTWQLSDTAYTYEPWRCSCESEDECAVSTVFDCSQCSSSKYEVCNSQLHQCDCQEKFFRSDGECICDQSDLEYCRKVMMDNVLTVSTSLVPRSTANDLLGGIRADNEGSDAGVVVVALLMVVVCGAGAGYAFYRWRARRNSIHIV